MEGILLITNLMDWNCKKRLNFICILGLVNTFVFIMVLKIKNIENLE